MKKILFGFLALVCLTLTSCLDLTETINLNLDGSGTYEVKMDMGGVMKEMQQKFGGGKKKSNKKMEKKDSTINFKNEVETASSLTAEEKRILGKGKSRIILDEAKGIMQNVMTFPFAKKEEFAIIQDVLTRKNGMNLGKMFGNSFKSGSKEMEEMSSMMGGNKDEDNIVPISSLEYKLSENSFSCKPIIKAKKETPKSDEDKMMEKMMEEMKTKVKVVINLPKPATSVDNKTATISPDKKKVCFERTISIGEALSNDNFAFDIKF